MRYCEGVTWLYQVLRQGAALYRKLSDELKSLVEKLEDLGKGWDDKDRNRLEHFVRSVEDMEKAHKSDKVRHVLSMAALGIDCCGIAIVIHRSGALDAAAANLAMQKDPVARLTVSLACLV